MPWYVKDQTARNLLFYVENLNNARFQAIDPAFPLIEEGFDERYHPMNPSIQKTEQGYKVICRSVNYTQMGAKIFNTIDSAGVFRTKNFLIHYDRDFTLLSQQEIIEDIPRKNFAHVMSKDQKIAVYLILKTKPGSHAQPAIQIPQESVRYLCVN